MCPRRHMLRTHCLADPEFICNQKRALDHVKVRIQGVGRSYSGDIWECVSQECVNMGGMQKRQTRWLPQRKQLAMVQA